jgi:tRNA uridine 5-carboxymethylaminomethyl modification enzyme
MQFEARRARFEHNVAALERATVKTPAGERMPAAQALRQPAIRLDAMVDQAALAELQIDAQMRALDIASVETTVKYAGYLKRQASDIERARRDERRRIPIDFPFDRVPGLSREAVFRLRQVRPDTIAHAARIPGLTPAAIAVLATFVSRGLTSDDRGPLAVSDSKTNDH